MRDSLPAKGAFFHLVFCHTLGRFTHVAAEILAGYYWLESLCKDLIVNICHSPWKSLRALQTRQGRHDLWVKCATSAEYKTDISAVLTVKERLGPSHDKLIKIVL